MSVTEIAKNILINQQDLSYEEEISRNPFYLKNWIKYLIFKKDAPVTKRYIIFERAVQNLPRSYKLWYAYLCERKSAIKFKDVTDKNYGILINTYERALVHLHKMPKIW